MLLLGCLLLVLGVAVNGEIEYSYPGICIKGGRLKNVLKSRARDCLDVRTQRLNYGEIIPTNLMETEVLHLELHNITEVESDALAIFPLLSYLDLGDNRLTSTIFLENLPDSIRLVHIMSNKITKIKSGEFGKFLRFETLWLKDNKIQELKANTLNGFSSLIDLSLELNHISQINGEFFRDLTSLKFLHLGTNKISSLDDGVFSHLKNIQKIHLENNQLTTIRNTVFSEIPKKLTLINLRYNPLGGDYSNGNSTRMLSDLKPDSGISTVLLALSTEWKLINVWT